jgi:hypothetical protein
VARHEENDDGDVVGHEWGHVFGVVCDPSRDNPTLSRWCFPLILIMLVGLSVH